jgi:thioesterase domain-containing protein
LFGIHDEDNGWGKLAQQGVDVRIVGGAHSNILENPHVHILAKELKTTLENAFQRDKNHDGS